MVPSNELVVLADTEVHCYTSITLFTLQCFVYCLQKRNMYDYVLHVAKPSRLPQQLNELITFSLIRHVNTFVHCKLPVRFHKEAAIDKSFNSI